MGLLDRSKMGSVEIFVEIPVKATYFIENNGISYEGHILPGPKVIAKAMENYSDEIEQAITEKEACDICGELIGHKPGCGQRFE